MRFQLDNSRLALSQLKDIFRYQYQTQIDELKEYAFVEIEKQKPNYKDRSVGNVSDKLKANASNLEEFQIKFEEYSRAIVIKSDQIYQGIKEHVDDNELLKSELVKAGKDFIRWFSRYKSL